MRGLPRLGSGPGRAGARRGREGTGLVNGETPGPEDDVILRWECPVCGWSIADENAGGEGQSCEAWMIDVDRDLSDHGECRPVRYLREGREWPVGS
jgi:hypothetical protein